MKYQYSFLSIILSVIFISFTTTASLADQISIPSGKWEGTYYYSSNSGRQSVNFTANINVRGRSFSGRIVEPRTFGQPTSKFLYAFIVGQAHPDGTFYFRKKYDGTAGVSHSVSYRGRINYRNMTVIGRWRIDRSSGDFEMRFKGN